MEYLPALESLSVRALLLLVALFALLTALRIVNASRVLRRRKKNHARRQRDAATVRPADLRRPVKLDGPVTLLQTDAELELQAFKSSQSERNLERALKHQLGTLHGNTVLSEVRREKDARLKAQIEDEWLVPPQKRG